MDSEMARFYTRRANSDDLPSIHLLMKENDLPTNGIEDHLNEFLVLISNNTGSALGVIGMELYGEIALLRSLAVEHGFRGMGFGEELVCQLERRAGDKGVLQIYLFTNTAEEFFAKRGYKVFSRDKLDNRLQESTEYSICSSATVMRKEIHR